MKVLTKFSTGIMAVLLVAAMASTFLACPAAETKDDPPPPEVITWTPVQDGGADSQTDSTGIRIQFSEEVTGLADGEVAVTGAAAKSGATFIPEGNDWIIPITVTNAGSAMVTITKENVAAESQSVTVFKRGQTAPIGYNVTANGTADSVTTTDLLFTFDKDMAAVVADNITITNGAGKATKGIIIGSGKEWRLSVAVDAQGDISVATDQIGIDTAARTVNVFFKAVSSGGAVPQKPVIAKIQDSMAFADGVDLKNPNTNNVIPSIALAWEEAAGAESYNLYWAEEGIKPETPNVSDIKDTSYFIRTGLATETRYYLWVEAVNQHGNELSDMRDVTTRNNTIERGDYPRNIKVEPADGQVTVWWDMPDRVGWHEIYYVKKGDIQHVDVYTPLKFKWDDVGTIDDTAYAELSMTEVTDDGWYSVDYSMVPGGKLWVTGYTPPLYLWYSPMGNEYSAYWIGKTTGFDGDGRPVVGLDSFGKDNYPTTPANAFPYVFEGWMEGDGGNNLGKLQPYTQLDPAFANAIPWDGTKAGTNGTPIPYYKNSVTITGLTNGEQYEIWIRCPNINGERGYGYVLATPGAAAVSVPGGIQVNTPVNTTRELEVKWNVVENATAYRVYFSEFNQTPTAASPYTIVNASEAIDNTFTFTRSALKPNTTYYVLVVAEQNGIAGEKGSLVSGKTGIAPTSGIPGKVKMALGSSQPVKTLMYVEVNENNPLNAGSYILEDGSYLIDYVVLFAGNIRSRNCAQETDQPHGCTLNGPHLHLNENVRYIVQNADRYIKPLQDKGIKVLMGILPDHDGISLGTMDATQTAAFVASVKEQIELYGLDGVDLDDEWASKEDWGDAGSNWPDAETPSPDSIWVYPTSQWWWPFQVTVYRNPDMGIVAGNGSTDPSISTAAEREAMWDDLGLKTYNTIVELRKAMPGKIITVYEYNTGGWITAGGTNGKDTNITAAKLAAQVDFFLNPMYNAYIDQSPNAIPNKQYAPIAIDVSGVAYTQGGTPLPPMDTTGVNSITDYATQFLRANQGANPYGFMCLYGLTRASELLKHYDDDVSATVPKEEYLSIMTEIVFGQKTILTNEGGDYRKDW